MRKSLMFLLIATIIINIHLKTGLVLYTAWTGVALIKLSTLVRRRREERKTKRCDYNTTCIEFEDERYKYD